MYNLDLHRILKEVTILTREIGHTCVETQSRKGYLRRPRLFVEDREAKVQGNARDRLACGARGHRPTFSLEIAGQINFHLWRRSLALF